MKEREKLINYTLSMGLIVLILLFLISIVQISRYVLDDANPISNHVASTRDLLNDIDAVEKSVEQNSDNNEFNNLRPVGPLTSNLKRIDNYNMPNGDGIITLVFDSKVQQFNDTYYLEVNSIDNLKVGEHILFRKPSANDGIIFNIDSQNIQVINFDTKAKYDLAFEDVIGKVIVRVKND